MDFDQGGTFRTLSRTGFGPSVGWAQPARSVLPITSPGTYTLDPSTTLVTVAVAGSVVVKLPSATLPAVVASTQPSLFLGSPITVIDIGGFAGAFPITIAAFGSEKIRGFSSIQITTPNGSFTLQPAQGGWT